MERLNSSRVQLLNSGEFSYRAAMGIRFHCPNGHKLNVKAFLAGKKGVCPDCGVKLRIPQQSEPGLGGHDDDKHDDDQDDTARATLPTPPQPVASSPQPVPVSGPQPTPVPQPATPKMVAPGSVTAVVRPSGVAIPTMPSGGYSPPSSSPPMATVAVAATPAQSGQPAAGFPLAVPAARGGGPGAPGILSPPPLPPGMSDPIAESPMSQWFVRPPSGGQFGPARGEVMRKWVNEGRVTADSLVWREGWLDWLAATDAFPQLIRNAPAPFSLMPSTPQHTTIIPAAPKRDNTTAVTVLIVLVFVCLLLAGVLFLVLSGGFESA